MASCHHLEFSGGVRFFMLAVSFFLFKDPIWVIFMFASTLFTPFSVFIGLQLHFNIKFSVHDAFYECYILFLCSLCCP